MASDENLISVINNDNHIVRKLGLTHTQLAKPLFHVLNMMDTDLGLNRWNMAKHRWDNIVYFYYNDHKIFVIAEAYEGTKNNMLLEFNNDTLLSLLPDVSLLTQHYRCPYSAFVMIKIRYLNDEL